MYEAHITFSYEDRKIIEEHSKLVKWSFSCINDDIVLGKGAYCYLTSHGENSYRLLLEITTITNYLVREFGVRSVRCKIEDIVYDTKTV